MTFFDVRRYKLNVLLLKKPTKLLVCFRCNGLFSKFKFTKCLLRDAGFLGQIGLAKSNEASSGPN